MITRQRKKFHFFRYCSECGKKFKPNNKGSKKCLRCKRLLRNKKIKKIVYLSRAKKGAMSYYRSKNIVERLKK